MELTPQQIKDLKRYSLLLQANNLEDGLTWRNDYWEGEGSSQQIFKFVLF
jgi:hypothetical protein